LPDPAILILDDSTSAVDVETEARIQEALASARHGRTSFIVAQRISTVLTADKILVLDNGRIVAEGTHTQLMASSPLYREIYASQLDVDGEAEPSTAMGEVVGMVEKLAGQQPAIAGVEDAPQGGMKHGTI
jgi:ATP-binding cassette subfamily B protein